MKPEQPQGKLKAVEVIDKTVNSHTVIARVVCVDEAGNQWEIPAAYLATDVKPYHPNQPEYRYWSQAVRDQARYSEQFNKLTPDKLYPLYREGKSAEEAFKIIMGKQ